MPNIFLSPSTQEYNHFVNGGTEEYYANLITDAVVPYLQSSGIRYGRNTPDMTASSSIAMGNAGNYDFYLAIHSNAAPESLSGRLRGTDVYYHPGSVKGKRMADILVENFKSISPTPDLVQARTTLSLGEVTRTRAPANLLEVAYHDNIDDANWIKNNIATIGRAIALSITQYFDLPLVQPQEPQKGRVTLTSGNLNIRSRPSVNSHVIMTAYNGAPITVLGKWEDWYVVDYYGTIGYAAARYIVLV